MYTKTTLPISLTFGLLSITHLVNAQQVINDSLKEILTSKSFTLEEEYIGDWGGHVNTFTFREHTFRVDGKNVRIQCSNPELLKNGKDLDVLLPISELEHFGKIFTNCSEIIKTSKKRSTEHIVYTFKNEKLTYVIDDRYTLECNEDFKAWIEMLLLEGQKKK